MNSERVGRVGDQSVVGRIRDAKVDDGALWDWVDDQGEGEKESEGRRGGMIHAESVRESGKEQEGVEWEAKGGSGGEAKGGRQREGREEERKIERE